jgi:hypothetical protein
VGAARSRVVDGHHAGDRRAVSAPPTARIGDGSNVEVDVALVAVPGLEQLGDVERVHHLGCAGVVVVVLEDEATVDRVAEEPVVRD